MTTERIDIIVSERGSRTVKRDIRDIGETAAASARGVDILRGALGALGAISLTAAVTQVLNLGREFTTVLAKIRTNVDETTFNMDKLTDSALRQAQVFASTPVAQTEALYDIISAGASTAEEAIDKLTAANKLAVGGITTVGVAADGLTSVLNAYGSKIGSAEAAADAMFIAARDGKTTIDALSSSLGRVAPIAAQMGVTFDEVNGVIAALTKGGVSTEESVTGLRAILASVAKPTKEAADMAKALGLEFSVAALQAKGFQGFMEDVKKKTEGSIPALSQLFGGVEALVPVLALTGQAGEDFAATMENMANKAGAAEAAFQKMAASPGFQISRIMSAITVKATELGMAILNALLPAITALADNIELVFDALASLAIGFAVIAAPTAILAGISAITTAFRLLTAVMIANPIGAVVFALTAATAAMYLFGDRIKVTSDGVTTLRDVAVAVFQIIGEYAQQAAQIFMTAWDSALNWVKGLWSGQASTAGEALQTVVELARTTVNTYIGLWVGAINSVVAAWDLFPAAIKDVGTMAWNGLITGLQETVRAIQAGVRAVVSAWAAFPGAIRGFAAEAASALVSLMLQAIRTVMNAIQGMLNWLGSAAGIVGAENPFANLVNPDGALGGLEKIKQGFDDTASSAKKMWDTMSDPDAMVNGLEKYKGQLSGAAKEVGKIVGDEFNKSLGTDYVGMAAGGASKAMDDVLKRAQQISSERIAAQKDADLAARMGGGSVMPALPDTPASQLGAGGGSGEARKKKETEELTEAQKKYKEVLDSIQQPEKDFQSTLAAANKLLAEGKINAEQHARAIREVSIAAAEAAGGPLNGLRAGLMSLQKDSQDMAEDISDAVQNAFSGMEDALVDFVTTGKMDFNKLIDSMLADIARLVIRYMVMQPIINALSGIFGGGGGLFGGSASVGGAQVVPMRSFATGGGFNVAGSGGVDSQLVQFMASPGERVSVARPGESTAPTGGGSTRTTVNVYNNGQPVQAQAETKQDKNGNMQIDVMLEQLEERMAGRVAKGGGKLNRALEGRYQVDPAKGLMR